jgi:ribosome-binding factor A
MKSHDYKRADRVGEQIRVELSDILLRKTKDPRVGFVTITYVKVSDDLRNARVFVSIIGDEARKKKALKGLKSGSSFLRTELGHRLQVRSTPELFFQLDESIEKGSRILELLRGLDIKEDEEEGE